MMKLFIRRKPKIGLALASGAARGLAHIGIIKAIKERNIAIDLIAGSSIGALVGACYARAGKITDLEKVVLNTDWRQLARLVDPNISLFFKGIIQGQKIKELLTSLIGNVEFKHLAIPLSVVACDIDTGEEVIIQEGSVVEAVRASISMPAIFTPVKLQGKFLIDGGIINPVPVSVARKMGATFVIAANTVHKPQRRQPFDLIKGQKLFSLFKMQRYERAQDVDPETPSIFDAIIQTIYTTEYEIAKSKIKEADLVITPDIGRIAAFEFYRGREVINEGYLAANNALRNYYAKGRFLRFIHR